MADISFPPRRRATLTAAAFIGGVAMAGTGLLHLGLAPVHLEHSVEHGLALYAVGVADVAWTSLWLQRRSAVTAWFGIALGVASLYLYAVSRVLPLPFEGQPEPVDTFGLATQFCEAAAFAALGAFALIGGTSVRRLAAVIGSTVAGASVLFAAASYASFVSGSGP
jgi:hypothetical protein